MAASKGKAKDFQGYEPAEQERKPDWNVATQGAPPEGSEDFYNVVPIVYAGDAKIGPGGEALDAGDASSDDSADDSSEGSDASGSDSGSDAGGKPAEGNSLSEGKDAGGK